MRVSALLVDIDNTLCHNPGPFGLLPAEEHKRRLLESGLTHAPVGPSAAHAEQDRVLRRLPSMDAVCEAVRRLAGEGVPTWFLTGRPAWLRPATEAWMANQGLLRFAGDPGVLTREEGDVREAEIAKLQQFFQHIRPRLRCPLPEVWLIDDAAATRALFGGLGVRTLDPSEVGVLRSARGYPRADERSAAV